MDMCDIMYPELHGVVNRELCKLLIIYFAGKNYNLF